MLSKSDMKKRSHGIGSSEIAMLVYVEDENGDPKPLSPWGGRHKLWCRKTGRDGEQTTKSYMTRGQYMETGLIDWYADDTGVEWKKPPTVRSKKYPYIVDSCDGLTYPKGSKGRGVPIRCVEAKTSSYWKRSEWGEAGTDEVPSYYLVQCQWHLLNHETQDRICDVPMDNGTQRTDYHVPYDEELCLSLIAEAEKFWVDYVKADKEPPVDDYRETTKWLSKYLKQREGMGLLEADESMVREMLAYKAAIESSKSAFSEADVIKEALMRCIGEHDGIIIPGTKQKILWRTSKDRLTVDWQSIAEHLAQHMHVHGNYEKSEFEELKVQHSTTKSGSRPWVPTTLLESTTTGARK